MLNIEKHMLLEDRKVQASEYLNKVVTIGIDRPIGTPHPKHQEILYPINYGYIPGVLGGDHEELDVYLLGVDEIVESYEVRIIAIVHRYNDEEDKLVGAPLNRTFTKQEITESIHFQEQFYHTHIEVIDEYEFINVKDLESKDSNITAFYAKNKYGDKFYVEQTSVRDKTYYRNLEKEYIDHKDKQPRLLHVIYRSNLITAIYEWDK